MTLPAGTITMDQVRIELGIAQAGVNLDLASVRTLAGAGASGTISMQQLQGKSAYTPMTITPADSYYDTGGGTGTQYSYVAHPTVSAAGGSGGYTYNWVFVSGTAASQIVNQGSVDPGFRYTIGKYGASVNAVYRCDVTDSTGHVASANVNITIV